MFKYVYITVCRLKLFDYRGVIESPNFPNPYPHNRNCSWIISAPPGNKINITFTHFELESPFEGNCSYDFLEVCIL
jgi:cubilin